ncbi:MAG: phenylalanine--tRNA ligase subunit beta [Myxococcaceae bacterium]|nr:phenylalanine--tRNA ligase subunit beta [Myxococcaceae bacterium]MBH2006133.1 phenylalanine--tRNA ligase subunit beta [Myxococcaceae bacterium]
MHISQQTLQTFLDLSSLSKEEIAKRLTEAGLEVEGMAQHDEDTIFELKVTPNRPDALSHIGVVRELAATLGVRPSFSVPSLKELGAPIHDWVQVQIEAKESCPRYACRIIEGVHVAPSPDWLVSKLESLGLKSINNVVDITNWVLLERGQPLHAFDLDQIAKSKGRINLRIRKAILGEKIVLLNDQECELSEEELVIADEETPIALAGVMGAKNTEVSKATQNILLESAYFEPTGIRKTAKRYGISTDSSYRFERGTDPNGVIQALERAASLMIELAGGRVRREAVDIYSKPIEPLEIPFRPNRLLSISGLSEIDMPELRLRFLGLGIEAAGRTGHDSLYFRAPTWRPDLREEIDLIEEAIRLIGFDQIPLRLSSSRKFEAQRIDVDIDRLEQAIRLHFSKAGFYECINYAFGSPSEMALFSSIKPIKIQNPLGEEASVMRTHLFPGLLRNRSLNLRNQSKEMSFFEIGCVFEGPNPNGSLPDTAQLTVENMSFDSYAVERLLVAGIQSPGDFLKLKGSLEQFFEALHASVSFAVASNAPSYFHPRQVAEIRAANTTLGYVGFLDPALGEVSRCCAFEIDLKMLLPGCFKIPQMKPLLKFPSIERDFALLVDSKLPAGNLLDTVRSFKAFNSLLESVEIFDVYQGKGVPEDKKSIALRIRLRHPERTLKDEEINPLFEELLQQFRLSHQAILREA